MLIILACTEEWRVSLHCFERNDTCGSVNVKQLCVHDTCCPSVGAGQVCVRACVCMCREHVTWRGSGHLVMPNGFVECMLTRVALHGSFLGSVGLQEGLSGLEACSSV